MQYCMPDEARDGQNVALKFLSDYWRARSSKEEFLHQNFSMPNIFHDNMKHEGYCSPCEYPQDLSYIHKEHALPLIVSDVSTYA